MKRKIFAVAAGVGMIFSLAGCMGEKETAKPEEVTIMEDVQIPNPFTEYSSLEEAVMATGFKITVPDEIEGMDEVTYRVMPGDMIEIIYSGMDEAEIRIRKAYGNEDISGDYNSYADSNEVVIGQKTVTMKGNDGKYTLGIWNEGDYSYSAGVYDMEYEGLEELIAQIQ